MKRIDAGTHVSRMGTSPLNAVTAVHHNDAGVDKSFSPIPKRFQRNPSFEEMAPHCVLMTRCCYCKWDDEIHKCEVGRTNKEDKSVHFSPHIFETAVTTKRKGRFGAADLSRAELVELDRDYQNRR